MILDTILNPSHRYLITIITQLYPNFILLLHILFARTVFFFLLLIKNIFSFVYLVYLYLLSDTSLSRTDTMLFFPLLVSMALH